MTSRRECTPPPHLTPRWRDLPRLAAVSAQAFAPARIPPGPLRAVFTPVWLLNLGVQHTAGSVLAVGPSTLGVQQPRRLRWHLLGALVLLPAAVVGLLAVMLPAALAAAAAGHALAGPTGVRVAVPTVLGAELVALAWQLVHLLDAARRSAELRCVLAPLRRTGPWGEVGGLAGGRDGQATRDLVRQTLRWADTEGLGLAATAASDRLQRLYTHAGFHPAHPGSPVLLRPPAPPAATEAGLVTPGRTAS
ncbi:hypothetical protein ACFWA9_29145 [Kitasatospora sp. NPDC059973]|uniref:hypothetical protein n=1 Tax=Kitasatospora sp. NPDC059973 TaxID=3347020 RepID=UPI0036BF7DC7